MKTVHKIVFFISLFALYFIVKELIQLIIYAGSIHEYFGYFAALSITSALVYFVALPLYKIFSMPSRYGPIKGSSVSASILKKRIDYLKKNPFLVKSGYEMNNLTYDEAGYELAILELNTECAGIRKKYVNQLFYSTSVSQNGFLDALLILSTAVNMVKEIFILYNGRVSTIDLWVIARKVYYSIIIGGSEGIEYVTEEIFSKLAADSLKSIPFIDKILSSLADGYINSLLLTRVSLITENYCTMLYINSEKDLHPSSKLIFTTTKDILFDIIGKLNSALIKISKEKSETLLHKAINPVLYVFEKSMGTVKDSRPFHAGKNVIKEGIAKIKNKFGS
jgi:hypothetical protein